ncbi:uncharacterized protein [Macrobrachium rosenbergii]|uniref:uncharacterized protein isoform X2 n=1 Tax=Macrobrachium rosenbergii TaxID=79674 RepID=UPI0034D549C8
MMLAGWLKRRNSHAKMAKLWLVLKMFSIGLRPVCGNPFEGHHTVFVTLPGREEEQSITTTSPIWSNPYLQDDVDEDSTHPPPVHNESPRSALLGVPNQERQLQVTFLADDREAASRIQELMTPQPDKSKALEHDQPLFPNTRKGPAVVSTTVQSLRTTSEGAENVGRTENYQVSSGVTESHTDQLTTRARSEQEIGSRHSSLGGLYRPGDFYHPLPPRLPPRPRPSHDRHKPGSSVIDKENMFHNNIYSGRPQGNGLLKRPYSKNMTRVTHIEAECQDDFMRIHVKFNGTFNGLIYSSGYAYDGDCIYVNGSGRPIYDFFIQLNRCGTLSGNEKGREDIRGRTPTKNMMWNTLTVQYNALIEEEWDEHFKVTCEYGYDFWKTVTFPFLDVEVQTGNPVVFTLTPPECHMEIRYGYGTAGTRVTGPVRVGDPLTLVIYMRSDFEGFDIVVSDCYAHNGGNKKITLIDHYGCPVDEKLISHFEGTWTADEVYETQVYAFMKTFRFTGSPALYIECDVRMCHGDCPTQPCHWRRGKKEKRSVSQEEGKTREKDAGVSPPPSNVSESLSLFQSIQVVRDEHLASSTKSDDDQDVCLKTGTVSALAGMVAVVLGILTAACGVMCIRLRRMKKQQDSSAPGTPRKPTMSYISNYKSDFVPPIKRRLE